MANRGAKGPSSQKKVTIPTHFWSLLEHFAELQTDAYEAMGGKTNFTVSDLLELGSEYYLRKVAEDLGPIPGPDAAPSERAAFVTKLVEDNKRRLLGQLYGLPVEVPAKKKA